MLPHIQEDFFMSMMNANAAATTAMTTNEPLDFVLPEMGDADFSSEELAEDRDGFTMSFPRIKIPAGGVLQFELPTGDPQHPDYRPCLLYTSSTAAGRAACSACWFAGLLLQAPVIPSMMRCMICLPADSLFPSARHGRCGCCRS